MVSISSRATFDWGDPAAFADRAASMEASPIREFLKLLGQPGIVSFAGGIPDPQLFPLDAIARSAAGIMADPARRADVLQYAASEGYAPLREWIAGYMTRLGVPCAIDNIVITSGSQQALDLLGKLFLDSGDAVVTTAPTYLGALQAFNVYEPTYATVTFDDGPRSHPAIDHVVPDYPIPPAIAYVVPEFANPSGETLPLDRREGLLDLLAELGIPVIEDAAYQALRFEGDPLPSLLALDIRRTGHIDRSRVIYTGTFSKTIAPGLRVGWVCTSRELVQAIVLVRQAADLHGATLDQAIAYDVVSEMFSEQVGRLIPVYRERRDVMLDALSRSMPPEVTWTRPDGGMFIWLTLPEGLDSEALLRDSIETERIIFVPGRPFFPDGSGERHIRLNYTRSDEPVIVDGIARLARLIARHMRERASRAEPRRPSLAGAAS
jgi:DNA-binding transcriptional MocR family regulator